MGESAPAGEHHSSLYDVLQVCPDADLAAIRAAYRARARAFHPDVSRDPDAARRMRELNAAYEVLSDPERRARYDAARARAARTRAARARAARARAARADSRTPTVSMRRQGPVHGTPTGILILQGVILATVVVCLVLVGSLLAEDPAERRSPVTPRWPLSAPVTPAAVGPPSAGATITAGGAGVSATATTAVPDGVPGAATTTPRPLQTTDLDEVATTAATTAAAPTSAPTATPTVTFRTVLDERFADNRLNWPNGPGAPARFADGAYRLSAREPGRFVAIGAPIAAPLRDVVATARFRKVGGPPGGGYGLIVRDQDPGRRDGINQGGRYYVLEVGDRGELGIWRREAEHWVELIPWTPSDAVRPGDAANELTVRAVGQRLTFLVNGTAVASQADPVLPEGGVGIFVGGDFNEAVLEHLLIQTPGE
jgi:hypothetical protein